MQALQGFGFEVNVVYETLPTFSPNDGRVISQSPQPDVEIDLGTIVTIVIGRGEELSIPDVASTTTTSTTTLP